MIPTDEPSPCISDHGTIIDKKKAKVRCNYCGKIVTGKTRLKYRLGCVRGDVIACPDVPANVKQLFQNSVLQIIRERVSKEVLSLDLLEGPPLKRSCCQRSSRLEHNVHEHANTDYSFSIGRFASIFSSKSDEVEEDIPSQQARKIGRFFYQNLIDVNVVNSAGFREMLHSVMGSSEPDYKIPSSRELKGTILRAELTEMQDHVRTIKQSWSSTGCSILLDTWTDEQGQEFVIILVDCPDGPISFRTLNVSSFIPDLNALQLMLNEVIEEVGVENVVQIVACTTKGWLGTVASHFIEECRTVFWTVSASHCIELMLEKIGLMGSVRPVLDTATILTKFMSKLMNKEKFTRNFFRAPYANGNSKIMAFVTVEEIVKQKEKLEAMVSSSEWEATEVGKRVAELVKDPSFWNGALMVLKASGPLLRVLSLIHRADKPLTGYIYETMDQMKEAVKKEFQNKESHFIAFWEVIDEIWDGHMHSPLHAAGYYLNPSLFYSSDFNCDNEVSFGLLCCIVRMIQDHKTQDLIIVQLENYRHGKGAFGEGSSITCRNIPPLEWWSTYGRECPELQRFATRILSQTCDGPSRYGLGREMAQKLTAEMNNADEQQLEDLQNLALMHYNLHLQYLKIYRIPVLTCLDAY